MRWVLAIVLLATTAGAALKRHESGDNQYPNRLMAGPCHRADLSVATDATAYNGLFCYCDNCGPGSGVPPPAGAGAECFKLHDTWVCLDVTSVNCCAGGGTTTTTAPPASTTTTTTVAGTTTTTSPSAITNNFLWVPGPPNATGLETYAANTLYCNAWVPELGISNATSINWLTASGGNCGVAIYNFDGSSRITTTGGVACGLAMATSSAFSITAGTMYQVCSCASSTPSYVTANGGPSGALSKLQNAFSTTKLNTTAANTCSGGSPPVTTGVLSTDTGGRAPIVLLLGTNTP